MIHINIGEMFFFSFLDLIIFMDQTEFYYVTDAQNYRVVYSANQVLNQPLNHRLCIIIEHLNYKV